MNSRKMQALIDTLISNQALLTNSLRLAAEEYVKSAEVIRKEAGEHAGLLSIATRFDEQSAKALELADMFEVLERE